MAVARKKKASAKKKPAKRKVAKRKPAAKKKVAKKRTTTKRKVAKRKPAAKKKVAKRKPAARKKATAKRKPAARKAAPRKKAKSTTKRKPNAAFMRPVTLSEALGEVVGHKAIPRTEVTKRLWLYIKKYKLQDNVNRRMINADPKLLKVFGGKKKVNMFEMTKLVSKHMK